MHDQTNTERDELASYGSVGARARHYLRERGLRAAARDAAERGPFLVRNAVALAVDQRFDRRHGVETSGEVPAELLGLSEERLPSAVLYDTPPADTLRAVFSALDLNLRDYTFLDLGSGKGRAVLVASEFPFAGIVGVELSEPLHAIATRNVERWSSSAQQCHAIELVHGDAADVDIPDGPLVVYAFVPFDAGVMREVVDRLAAAHEAQPRDIQFVHLTDPNTHPFDPVESGFVEPWYELTPIEVPVSAALRYDLVCRRFRLEAPGAEAASDGHTWRVREAHAPRLALRHRVSALLLRPGKVDVVRRRGSLITSLAHDRVRGIDTRERKVDLDFVDNGVHSDNGTAYEPSFYAQARAALRNVPFAGPHHLVDYGAGRGRMMFVAQELRWARATGVEYTEALHDDAIRNLETARGFSSSPTVMEAVHADATEYPVEPTQNVFYFYNPFDAEVFDQVLDRIEESLRSHPRPACIIYLSPRHADLFESREFVEVPISDWRGIQMRMWCTPDVAGR